MAFQIKDFASVSASLVNLMRAATNKVTDFNIGSVVRSMLDAIAAELEELYLQMMIGLREAIPVSVYNTFSFARIEANSATGAVRVVVTSSASPVLIPSGTTFTVDGVSVIYTSTADVTVTPGNTYADVPVAAGVAGAVGNLAAGQSFTPKPAPDGFVSASNLVAFINGIDQELDDAQKTRFNQFIASLNRGTVAALQYGLGTTTLTDPNGNIIERVVSTSIIEPWIADNTQPISLVNCYIHNGAGGTSGDLVGQANRVVYGYYDANGKAVPGWKAAGVQVNVFAATEQPVNVTATLYGLAGYTEADLVTAAQQAIAAYITALPIGVTALRSEMVALVMGIIGVYNFTMTLPAGDTAVANSVKLMPGSIAITAG